ncbi:endonuclease III [Candidatus Desulfofervidus auxilii]|uniref:Endonuclease III n=1 Tax=Desulfofervidus auxilii TaxID=1621989 RepID=A0A7U4TIQ0_DESA2|nr:endonuclease III [Candidatus Desulfofervidus auxilii]CAD7775232.1 MAG: Endonuclease III [Candidatus Methanoperedenaceae archaeon GB50]CAD7779781.1 Endonuclease III [Candidatus Methanoperedenaceae archaeon GB37]AMM41553.1 endonuclease III [Candidatus Desulfofervidus auxilii]CAD7778670.1 Endonuclease III [Candidatus Methanoperedenaceae archaeon GB50]CAD7782326.1 MAG: Endonuclease III [Candidatus Methanoperedenaceae archaeon GB37]
MKEKVKNILKILDEHYPNVRVALNYTNPLELLIATILSAQCTDERVNQITPYLFKKYPTAKDYATADLKTLEEDIKPTGFYKNKAKHIKECCQVLVEKYHGQVPANLEILTKLPGIGRKTANVVLGNAFDIPGIVVDTHVRRVAKRLGLTKHQDALKIEKDLMQLIPKEKWTKFSLQLTWHGRRICKARKPQCNKCPLHKWCDEYQKV